MTVRELWVGSVYVVEWDLLTVADGTPLTDAVVAGEVRRPAGDTAPMTVEHQPGTNRWRVSYAPPAAGEYAYRITAETDGAPAGAIGGTFLVNRERTGAAPITLDTADPVGMVRLLITDTDEAFPLFTDEQVRALLAMEDGVVKRAAAAALETIATSETLIGKKISTQDLSTDGPAVATSLMARAKVLREQADAADGGVVNADSYGFDFVDFPTVGTHPGVWW